MHISFDAVTSSLWTYPAEIQKKCDRLTALFNELPWAITKKPGNNSNPKMGTWLNK